MIVSFVEKQGCTNAPSYLQRFMLAPLEIGPQRSQFLTAPLLAEMLGVLVDHNALASLLT